ncbi:MAG: Stp1/IreP family PP2C-type Ser/Thr phosphatase [Azonexus sp.]|nr:Stp1/IreP family PP2C-type Ser/Thr phosphatase [Azonexus sp.]MDZ4313890.1 Stp1/IreP family PP2C-type Ser/Thr phosphatase [Azonexus sp.]
MKLADALEIVVRTDPGKARSHNEDAVFADVGLGMAILADGMGGYNAGEVASGMATTLLASNFARYMPTHLLGTGAAGHLAEAEERLAHEVAVANRAIYNTAQSQPQYAGMATTLVIAWFYDNRLVVGHIGDSRLYLWRGEHFYQLTRDHSLLQEQLDSGMISLADARHSLHKNLVTRGLGVGPEVETEIHDYDVQAGDIVLLCSDGLTDMIEDAEIALVLQTLGQNLTLAADHLVQLANDNGGRDNISLILIKVVGEFSSPKGWWQKLLARLK